eukprot:TRINITY_DN1125_c3_g1_i1.p1 TRINITY_DN1125_c3_g1~~TRINITY_DN1125_c3_g1_i1.p1  ORF type:complete len:858 (+),score=341.97 TRINITY_DN1125_c3_g1_i1:75-2576(+)
MEDYEKLWRIGTGGQGKVHRVRSRKTAKDFALKQIVCKDNYEMNFALHEIKVLTQIKHEYIISFHDFFIHKDRYSQISICLVMELCECGDLSDRIREARHRRTRFEEARIVKWNTQICMALNHLHEQDFIHRDVKPTNIFFTTEDAVRLGDFGLSRRAEAGRKTVVGTPYYFAPELMLHQRYTNKVDMWGVGVVVLELCTLRERPINSQLLQGGGVLADAEAEVVGKGYSRRLAQLCRALMSREPHHRPSARDILRKWTSPADLERSGQGQGLRQRSRSGGPAAAAAVAAARQEGEQERESLMKKLAARDDEVKALKLELERVRRMNETERRDDRREGRQRDRPRDDRRPLGDICANQRQAAQKDAKAYPRAPVVTPTFQQKQAQPAAPRPATAEAAAEREKEPAKAAGAATARARGADDAVPAPRAAFTAVDDPALADLTASSADASAESASALLQPRRQEARGQPGEPIRVQPGESIQSAIESAPAGAKIVVEAGVYTQPLHVDRAVTIAAVDAQSSVVIEVANKTAVSVSAAAELSGLIIRQRRVSDTTDSKWVACDFRNGSKSASLHHCELSSEGGACITIHGNTEPTIRHCSIHDGSQAGVYIFDGAKALIEHNNIYNNTYAALLLKRKADPVVRHNRIHSGRDTGVFICHESKGTIEDNEIYGNGGSGVVVKGAAEPRIVRNSVHTNTQAGVFVCDRGGGVIAENDISKNLKAGVLIKTKAAPIVEKNKIHSGKETGVYCFEGGNGTIRNNVISGNQNAGILITTKADPTVEGNVVKGNKYEGVWVCMNGCGTIVGNDLRGNGKGAIDVEESVAQRVVVRDNVGHAQ